jgi:FkbM family methyltransferase
VDLRKAPGSAFIWNRFKNIPLDITTPIIFGPLKGTLWIANSGVIENAIGKYESEKIKFVLNKLRKNTVFYDIGANVGYYSLMAANKIGQTGKVVAIEPLPSNIRYLRRHLQLNNVSNVEIIEAALSSSPGMLYFSTSDSNLTGHLSNSGNIVVRAMCLDELILNGKPIPDYIKMDIEGGEYQALLGAREILKNYSVEIFLATHGEEVQTKCVNLLNQYDYTIIQIGYNESELYCFK